MTVQLETRGLRERVDEVLAGFLDEQEDHLRDMMGDSAQPATGRLRAFLSGGKRLRPLFCLWGWRGAGGAPDAEEVFTAAASLELLHAFALIHDDIMDGSELRRGEPSLHRAYALLHASNSMRGSSKDFGTGVGILLGDLCLGWYQELLDRCAVPYSRLAPAKKLMSYALTELIIGQYLDLAGQGEPRPSLARAEQVVRYKTAKYTIERPLHLGGILAGADGSLLAAYSAYALPLGEAFQLRDDLLGAFGDPAVTGKPDADDLRSGKATVLLALTRERATGTRERAISRMLDRPRLADADVERLRELMIETGAVTEVSTRISGCADAARRALEGMDVDEHVSRSLGELIDAAAHRSS